MPTSVEKFSFASEMQESVSLFYTPVTVWPPEFDAIKADKNGVIGRVKNTDVWLKLGVSDLDQVAQFSPELAKTLLAWHQTFDS